MNEFLVTWKNFLSFKNGERGESSLLKFIFLFVLCSLIQRVNEDRVYLMYIFYITNHFFKKEKEKAEETEAIERVVKISKDTILTFSLLKPYRISISRIKQQSRTSPSLQSTKQNWNATLYLREREGREI